MSGGVEEREEYDVRATWGWMECIRARIFDAYDVCLFSPASAAVGKERPTTTSSVLPLPLGQTTVGREVSQSTTTDDGDKDGDKENIPSGRGRGCVWCGDGDGEEEIYE